MTNRQNNPPPRRLWWRVVLCVLAVLLGLVLVAASIGYALYWRGRADLLGHDAPIETPESLVDNAEDEGRLVTYQGKTYRYNDHVVSLLFMGVDKTNINADASYGKNGQADSLFVATLDTKSGAVHIIPLSREIMTEVNVYTADGNFIGVEELQLCLAYAYGSTPEQGCENVLRSVNRLLYGLPIDAYVAIDLDGLNALNTAVGGVRVTVLEDIKFYHDPTHITHFKKGQPMTLNERTLIPYIQYRDDDIGANNRRMLRQQQFLNEFIRKATNNVKGNFTLVEKYYNTLKPYAVSDLTLSKLTYLAGTYLVGGQTSIEYLPVNGDTKLGEEYVEFYPDESSLYEAVLAAFYTKE